MLSRIAPDTDGRYCDGKDSPLTLWAIAQIMSRRDMGLTKTKGPRTNATARHFASAVAVTSSNSEREHSQPHCDPRCPDPQRLPSTRYSHVPALERTSSLTPSSPSIRSIVIHHFEIRPLQQFNHTMIRVKDPKVSLHFYQDVLGMDLISSKRTLSSPYNRLFSSATVGCVTNDLRCSLFQR